MGNMVEIVSPSSRSLRGYPSPSPDTSGKTPPIKAESEVQILPRQNFRSILEISKERKWKPLPRGASRLNSRVNSVQTEAV